MTTSTHLAHMPTRPASPSHWEGREVTSGEGLDDLHHRRKAHRGGVALIMVLVLIVMLSLGIYAFTDLMLAQQAGTQVMGHRTQARAAVASGVEYLKDYLSQDPELQLDNGGHYDNPNYFSDVVVDPTSNLRFSIISIVEDTYGEPSGIRYGLYDLGARINVNALATADGYKTGQGGSGGGDQGGAGGGDDGGGDQGDDGGGDEGGGDNGGGDSGGPGDGGGDPGGFGDGGGDSGGDGGGDGGGDSGDAGEGDDPADPDGLTTDPARAALMVLPGMTEDIADSILDWIDEDETPRQYGAEAEYYSYDGYAPRNGPINSLDELLLVKGVTQELLFGADRNHNGLIDDNELDLANSMQAGTSSMGRGWSAYLTILSMDSPPTLEEPIDLNQDDLEALYDEILTVEGMDEDIATYIAAYRQSGPYTLSPPQGGDAPEPPTPEQVGGRSVDLTQGASQQITSVLDLVGSMTQANFGGRQPTVIQSPLSSDPSQLADLLPTLMSSFQVGEAGPAPGRININHCNQTSLASVPGINENLVQSIIGQQDPSGTSTDPNVSFPTWPLAFGLATVEEMKALLPFLSTSGGVYTAQIVAYSDLPGGFARAEVVIDVSDGAPRVISLRDLTHLGPGFTFNTE